MLPAMIQQFGRQQHMTQKLTYPKTQVKPNFWATVSTVKIVSINFVNLYFCGQHWLG